MRKEDIRIEFEEMFNEVVGNNTAASYLTLDMMKPHQINIYIEYLENKIIELDQQIIKEI